MSVKEFVSMSAFMDYMRDYEYEAKVKFVRSSSTKNFGDSGTLFYVRLHII